MSAGPLNKLICLFSKSERLFQQANRCEDDGNHSEALRLRKECYEYCLEKKGKDNKSTLVSLMNLALSYHSVGDIEKSFELKKMCYEDCVRYLGEKDALTISSLSNLALEYSAKGDNEEALS